LKNFFLEPVCVGKGFYSSEWALWLLLVIVNHIYFSLQVVPGQDWWWAGWAVLSLAALILNVLFITIVIKQR
jgi:hypothetical protein